MHLLLAHHLEVCASIVNLLNSLLKAGQNGLPPTPDTLHLECSYHLHSSHRFLSLWGAVMLDINNNNKVQMPNVMLRFFPHDSVPVGSKQQTCASTGIKERVLCHDHQHIKIIQNSLLRCTNLVIGEKCMALGTKKVVVPHPQYTHDHWNLCVCVWYILLKMMFLYILDTYTLLTALRTSVRKSLLCINCMEFPYSNFEVHLLGLFHKCYEGCQCIVVVR